MLVAGEIRRERDHYGGNRAGALQAAARDDGPDVVRSRGQEAACGEHEQADVDHRLPSPAVGSRAERNLQDRLRKTIGAERDADQREVVAARELRRVQREHREDQKQPEHAQAEYACEGGAGTHFGRAHAFRSH
jgi:hypothetical protein